MAELQICLLGSFQICWDFHPVAPAAWRNPLSPRLVKLVLVHRPRAVQQLEVARLLGARSSELEAALQEANRVMAPAACLQVSPDGQISFHPGAQCWVDLDAMCSHYDAGVAAAGRGDMFPAILAFQEADALYQGDLLEETKEPWAQPLREQLHQLYTEILERLAEGHAVLARYQDAIGFCHKALAHDRMRESTYQRMMVFYYYLGDMTGAEEAFHACRSTLESSGRQVSPETLSLWERLNRREVGPSPGAAAASGLDKEKT